RAGSIGGERLRCAAATPTGRAWSAARRDRRSGRGVCAPRLCGGGHRGARGGGRRTPLAPPGSPAATPGRRAAAPPSPPTGRRRRGRGAAARRLPVRLRSADRGATPLARVEDLTKRPP